MRKVLPIIVLLLLGCAAFYVWQARRARGPVRPRGPVLTVTFLEAKLGGGMVVQTPDGTMAIIDPGPESRGLELVRYLETRDAGAVTVVLSNPSPQRAGALTLILESFKVDRIVRGEIDSRSGDWSAAISDARDRGVPDLLLSAGDGVGLSKSVRFEALSPPKGLIDKADAGSLSNSLVGIIRFGGIRILLASDAGIQTEGHLIGSRAEVSCDVLAVGRHGDSGATTLEFISLARPRCFIVSAGGLPGRPSRAVLSRIEPGSTGAEVYRTDREGRVALITDGRTIAVETERGGRE